VQQQHLTKGEGEEWKKNMKEKGRNWEEPWEVNEVSCES
jgi:hypothetical protein